MPSRSGARATAGRPQVNPAVSDILMALRRSRLVMTLGWQDVRGRYRRSSIGPFWLTISMGILIASIGFVFGRIFDSPIDDYLPFLAAGIILWSFVSGTITEGCTAFIDSERMIKQLPIPLFLYVLRVLWRNLLILVHNLIILPLVLFVMGKGLAPTAVLAIPGLVMVALWLSWITLLLALLSTRYRDMMQIITSALQVVFYVTPIIWMPASFPDRIGASLIALNPMFHLLEIVRQPLLGFAPTATNWWVVTGTAVLGWLLTLTIFARLRSRVAYWL